MNNLRKTQPFEKTQQENQDKQIRMDNLRKTRKKEKMTYLRK